jgi:CubicO group peptidase (beta-lactamase class C family)
LSLALAGGLGADEVDDFIRARMQKAHIPGAAVAIVREGAAERIRAYGTANLEWDAAVTPDTAFQLASATKVFTGTLAMMLVERGTIALDDRISGYIDGAPKSWDRITIRHLLNHTSGLPDDLGPGMRDTAAQVVEAARSRPLAYEPGTRSAYGFTDYVVLSSILEKATGTGYAALLRDLITRPLGMTSTRFNRAADRGPLRIADPIPRRASVYQWEGGAQKAFDFLYGVPGYAAGGLYASAADLAKFFEALEAGRLLKPESLEAMWTRPDLGGGGRGEFGLGWVVRTHRGRKVVGHSGGPALADLLYFPGQHLAVVVLINQHAMYPFLAEGVADRLLPATPSSPALEDDDPALTVRLAAVLRDAGQGKVDPDQLAPAARDELVASLMEAGPLVIGVFDPIVRMELVEERRGRGRRVRKYRVLFGDIAQYWQFTLDSDGKIAAMQPTSE